MNLYPLIKILADGRFHTGTVLGSILGISRTAVWKQVRRLSVLGLEYQMDKPRGYALLSPLDLLDSSTIQSLLSDSSPALKAETIPTIDSTNMELLRRVNQGLSIHGTLLTAEMQTLGRGRRGRGWFSPFASSISMSIGWDFDGSANELQGLSLAVGVAIQKALQGLNIEGAGLKWPNDIYTAQGKLGGILIEITGDLAGPCQLIVGVGINVVSNSFANEVDQAVGFIDQLSTDVPTRSQIVVACAEEVVKVLEQFQVNGFSFWQDEWNKRHIWAGQAAKIITQKGETAVVLGGVNAMGELEVVYPSGERAYINSGEVSVRINS
ncbi:MAG: biotin--[acetyl-CoA-carboxylase] ligase [Marinospirillum sp.]|uniref:biotin--[acetyl-CoA-carboxylase] ligase n=1 Tax=Marinospirillum sp. TaxID=2183934 RepID=UPI0019DB8F32|nr:biotin--[acetyl-CoA-carboxylase] ligase [Marinospirillum sp.]MBE0505412.1 biotin--[acetyl-CoA-carboxylase] ligase [Marinospirillum sp.]